MKPVGSDQATERTVHVTGKVRLIVETVAQRGSLTIAALASETEISKTTTRRLVAALVEWGMLERDGAGVRLGRRLAELGQLAQPDSTLRTIARPFAVDLFTTIGRPITVSVLDGAEVFCVEKVAMTVDPHSPWMGIGTRAPSHSTAPGKAILAFSPPHTVMAVLRKPLRRLTPFTICTAEGLRAELRDVRRRGWAVSQQETHLGSYSLGVPILDRTGEVIGALSTSYEPDQVGFSDLVRALRAQAAKVSEVLP